jgi:hypothetical protein
MLPSELSTLPDVPAVTHEAYYRLWQFFGGYFHEDWMDDYKTWQNAVDAFVAEGLSEHVRKAADDLDRLLGLSLDGNALGHAVIFQLGCSYWPSDDVPYEPWLRDVLTRLSSAGGKHVS